MLSEARTGIGSRTSCPAGPVSAAPGQGQSTLRRCRPVDRQDGGTVARPARTLRQVEHGLAALRPLGCKGVWQKLFGIFQDGDLEWLILDSTVVRAHPHAAGAAKSSGGQAAQSLGRSRGGFGTKVHAAVSGLLLPVALLLSAGQKADVSYAKARWPRCQPRPRSRW